MKKLYLLSSVFLGLSASVAGVGCQDSFKDCENARTCPPPEGDGDGDSSTGGVTGDGDGDGDGDGTGGGDGDTGGTGTGGGAGDGDGDGDGDSTGGMGGDPNNPCLLCGDDEQCTPEGECVECLISDHCLSDEAPVCDTDTGVCVECDAPEDCEDPALPMCESNVCVAGCLGPEDCGRFAELDLCDAETGTCVECLTRDDCPGDVCARATHSCVDDREAGDVGVCEECEYDDDCAEGQLCVEQSFQSTVVGNFCTWRKDGRTETVDASCLDAGRPYAGSGPGMTSVEGQTADMCILATTSCPAFIQHRQIVIGCVDESELSDAACGFEGVEDGLCRVPEGGGNARCTYPCGGNEDCRTGFTCPAGDGSYCSL